MISDSLPPVVEEFAQAQPEIWEAYNQLGAVAAQAGPLAEKARHLVKLAIAIGAGREGAVRSHTRRGLRAGLTHEELQHVALLAITTAGWPMAFASYCWINQEIEKAG